MANLSRRRGGAEVHEALKTVNSEWDNGAPISLATAATVATKIEWPTLTLILTPDNDVYIDFDAGSTDVINTSNADILYAGESYEIDVPWGEAADMTKDDVYLQLKRVNAVATSVKITKG